MSNLTVENVYTRQNAKELAKKHFWKLLGMMVVMSLVMFAITLAGVLVLSLFAPAAVSSLNNIINAATPEAMLAAANPLPALGAGFIITYLVIIVVVTLVSGALSLGMTSAMIDLCRGAENVTIGRLFSRMGQCLKVFGLNLWVSLKLFLWMLPAVAVVMILAVIAASSRNETLLILSPLFIMILLFALAVPAAFRYMLSTYVLADKPQTGVFACVNESKALMKGHKWQAFKLIIPFVLVFYGLMVAMMLVFALLMGLLAKASAALVMVLTILFVAAIIVLALIFAMRVSLAYCIFYLKRQGVDAQEEPAKEPLCAE